jgi:hypothetical protein
MTVLLRPWSIAEVGNREYTQYAAEDWTTYYGFPKRSPNQFPSQVATNMAHGMRSTEKMRKSMNQWRYSTATRGTAGEPDGQDAAEIPLDLDSAAAAMIAESTDRVLAGNAAKSMNDVFLDEVSAVIGGIATRFDPGESSPFVDATSADRRKVQLEAFVANAPAAAAAALLQDDDDDFNPPLLPQNPFHTIAFDDVHLDPPPEIAAEPSQRDAFTCIIESIVDPDRGRERIFLLHGGPGSGKSYVSRALTTLLNNISPAR